MMENESSEDDNERYYSREVYVCLECGSQWETPGAAELCHKKDRVMELVEKIDQHKQFALNDVIEQLEQYVEEE